MILIIRKVILEISKGVLTTPFFEPITISDFDSNARAFCFLLAGKNFLKVILLVYLLKNVGE